MTTEATNVAAGPRAARRGPPGDPKQRRQRIGAAVAAIALLIAVYGQILYYMVLHWGQVPDYSHGFLVLPLALFFAYERRRKLRRALVEGSWWGLLPLTLGLISLAVGRLGVELTTMRSGFVFTLMGIVLLLLGRRIFSILSFPLFFLFLAVPLPQTLVNIIAFPLQLVAAGFAVQSLHLIGIPALLEGNIIHLAHVQLFVHEACAGLRSLMSLLTLGVIIAYFFHKRLAEQVIIVASAIPIAIFVNALRVALTGVLAHHFGEDAATGMVHDFEGLFTFVLAFFILLGEAHLLTLLWSRLPSGLRARLA